MPQETKSVQYTIMVDTIIYGPTTNDFSRLDWMNLARAAVDQASACPGTEGSKRDILRLFEQIERMIAEETEDVAEKAEAAKTSAAG